MFDLDRTARTLQVVRRGRDRPAGGRRALGARSEWRDLITELADRLGMWAGVRADLRLRPAQPRCSRAGSTVSAAVAVPDPVGAEPSDLTRLSTQDPNPVPTPDARLPRGRGRGSGRLDARLRHSPGLPGRPGVRRIEVDETLEILAADRPGANADPDGRLQRAAGRPRAGPAVARADRCLGRRAGHLRTAADLPDRQPGQADRLRHRRAWRRGAPARTSRTTRPCSPPATTGPWWPTCR